MGLLPRMEARPWTDGKTITYRYHPYGGKPINLGTDRNAAIRKVLDMDNSGVGADAKGTTSWVWGKYKESVRWERYAQATRDDYEAAWKQIEQLFGDVQMSLITPPDVARYVHIERADAPRRADIEKSLLSRLFGHAIKLGVCSVNSTIGVEPHGGEARSKEVSPEVLAKYLKWLSEQTPQRQIIGMAAEYASLAGNRKVEFLQLTWPQIDEAEGVVRTVRAKQRGSKRGAVTELVTITPALAALIKRLRHLRAVRDVDCLYVFPTRDNNAYTARGFKTLWQRCVQLALKTKVLTPEDRFTFHDLRAYYATIHKSETGALPDLHANPAVTARVYDRNKQVTRSAL